MITMSFDKTAPLSLVSESIKRQKWTEEKSAKQAINANIKFHANPYNKGLTKTNGFFFKR